MGTPPETRGQPVHRDRVEERTRIERELLNRRRAARTIPVRPRPTGELRFPAAVSQEGMWQAVESSPGPSLAIVSALRLRGPLDVAALGQAWNAVIARHETLRTAMRVEDGRLTQVVAEQVEVDLAVGELDLADLDRTVHEEVDRPFPLDHAPLARLRLFRVADDDHVALLLLHHIIGEARSLEVVVRDLAAYYVAELADRPCALPPLPLQWVDYAAWQSERLAGAWGSELIAYWSTRLAGALPAVLPTDREQGADTSQLGEMLVVPLSHELYGRLSALAKDHRTTLYTLGLAAFTVLLARNSGQHDVAVNAPVSCRNRTELLDLVADFSGDVIIRTDLSGNPTFAELINKTHQDVTRDFAHPDLPPHLLAPHLDAPDLVERMSHVQFTAEHELDVLLSLGELRTERITASRQYVLRPLSVRLRYDAEQAVCQVRYRTSQFSPQRIERLMDQYLGVLEEMTGHQDRRVLTVVGGQ
ncbi:condensation domain-containing protein [Streptomyces albicerus]|uniref:condensation domain-containing protein n=1 Tax=Streptomyces albicerus TaxID=2569859 RepID=UPI00124AECF5|nr:condensation domain-containing protein [Streptomyces albicerus]